MRVEIESQRNEILLQVEGHMDFPTHQEFQDASGKALEAPGVDRIVIDLTMVTFMDSAALGMLLLLRERADARGRKVVLRNPSPTILKLFSVVNFQKFFEIQN
ncbi:MAG TPA: STAS domain-containing protein [Holophagaceae bacterium]|nr:STAS domain-containing protein [Holophagaceae bacterium]